MNFLAFALVLAAGIIGVVYAILSGWKTLPALPGWAIGALAAGVIIQETLLEWSHTIHTGP